MTAATTTTQVTLGGTRGGPDVATLRKDKWWVQPVLIVSVLTTFVIYSTWAAFQNKNYYAGANLGRDLLSPFYSPCLTNSCGPAGWTAFSIHMPTWFSPALIILIVPLGFRMTCYYYRRSYYRAFWWSPPACAVSDAHIDYTGETRLPLVIQNVHRYFFYLGLILNVLLTYDAVKAFQQPTQGWGITVGTVVLTLNATLLWCYSLSCHACRHLCGGHVKSFAQHPIRHWFWKVVTPLNAKHMNFAWLSLIVVGLTDVYVRLVASGAITDYTIIHF